MIIITPPSLHICSVTIYLHTIHTLFILTINLPHFDDVLQMESFSLCIPEFNDYESFFVCVLYSCMCMLYNRLFLSCQLEDFRLCVLIFIFCVVLFILLY